MKLTALCGIAVGFVFIIAVPCRAQTLTLDRTNQLTATQTVAQSCSRTAVCLVPTINMWTFLELNTETGAVWEVQFGTSDKERYRALIGFPHAPNPTNGRPGRFALYPTRNNYNFLLVDTQSSLVWQVQWGTSEYAGMWQVPFISLNDIAPESKPPKSK